MNTQLLNAMVDDDFIVTIHDAADSLPATEPDFVSPDMMGEMDAHDGLLCLPEMYYADRVKCALYAAGYEAVAGRTLLSEYWLVGSVTPSVEDDYSYIAKGY